jgi:RecA-family ATPase
MDVTGALNETTTVGELADILRSEEGGPTPPWRLVILDPASRFMGPDAETDNASATRFVEVLERFAQTPSRPAVLITHHTNKSARAAGANAGQTAARGSSALVDGVRWVANLEPRVKYDDDGNSTQDIDPSRISIVVVKTNYGPTPPRIEIRREDGGTLRAMTPVEVERERMEFKRRKSASPKSATRSGHNGGGSHPLPTGSGEA